MSNLFPKEKRQIQIREVPEFPSPTKITGVRRARNDADGGTGKKSKHSLDIIPLELGPEHLGFMVGCDGSIGLARKSPKKRGRPRGSTNKKPAAKPTFNSMASTSGTVEGDDNLEVGKQGAEDSVVQPAGEEAHGGE